MAVVHDALADSRARRGAITQSGYSRATLFIPGPNTSLKIGDFSIKELMAPQARETAWEKLDEVIIAVVQEEDLAAHKANMRFILGTASADFVMAAPTPEARMARLIWVMGHEHEVDTDKLVVTNNGRKFGVAYGLFVGGPFDNTEMGVDVTEFCEDGTQIVTRSRPLLDARWLLMNRSSQDAYKMFTVLTALSSWDTTIPFQSLLRARPKGKEKNLDEIENTLLEVDDPYRYLYKLLVPYTLTYNDYIKLFGNPEGRRNLQVWSRMRLVNKLRELPFFK